MESPLRSHMPVAERYAYFDHAAVAPLPAGSAAAMAAYAEQSSASGDVHWLEWAAKLENLRSLAAELLNVQAVELALTANTTHGINFVVEGFPWKPGDNVVVPDNEFPSNFLPWQSLVSRGVELRRVPVPESGRLTADSFAALLDQRTRMISLSWVGFASGFRVDVAKVVEIAHRRGVLVMLDAIQGLGAFPLDLAELGVDFLAADGHKWMLGPEGAGLFFIKQEHLNLLRPVGLGWNSLATGAFEPGATAIKASAERYEGGTLNMPGFHALLASLKLLKDAGLNNSRVAHAILERVGMIAE
ncbi:MAG: aminotransferase class V-fold PLP-dependent enzyme, partial [bacterium]|nr:aminotransferase class V-fold PLP-dependent enzyme [bacterium]